MLRTYSYWNSVLDNKFSCSSCSTAKCVLSCDVKFLVLLLRDVHGFVSSYLCVDGSCFACYIIRNSNWVESTFNISSPYLSLIHIQSILVKKLVCAEFGALCKVDFQITCGTCSVNVSNSQEVRNFQLPIQLV